MAEEFTPDQMRAMAERVERAAQPNADASEYKDTAAMLRQGARIMAEAKVLRAELQESATGSTEVSKAVSAICAAMDRRGLC